MSKLSARVIEQRDGGECHVDYYVRAVETGAGGRPFAKDRIDAWAAYREEPVLVPLPGGGVEWLFRVLLVSDAPRATPEEAAKDMRAALRVHLDPDRLRHPARLVHGS